VPQEVLDDGPGFFEDPSSLRLVLGGGRRQDSVFNALLEVTSDVVVVHDAARPLAGSDTVRRVVERLDEWDGAIAAVPVDETVKRVTDHRIDETVDRSDLWQAQTPQAFRTSVLRDAHERARADGVLATDDASLVETYGGRVCVVPASRTNIKVTYPEDFALAESLLRSRP
jgi:2-C-methyl-D-erythritol 4-phosphate cytidylyltransferase